MSLGMQWRTVQIFADINTRVYVFIRSWRQDPSVGSFKQHGKWLFLFFISFIFSLNISCQVQTPGHSPGKRGVSTSRWSIFLYFLTLQKKTCSLLFVFVLKEIKCLLQGFGIFNAFFSRTGKASLIQRAISTRIETQKEKHTMKLGQLKINCLP